jgi:hypothetical protein
MSVFIVAAAAAKRRLSDLSQFEGRIASAAMRPRAFTAGRAILDLHQISWESAELESEPRTHQPNEI